MIEIKNVLYEDFLQYRKPSMFIGFPFCTMKCEKDCGERVCQNHPLLTAKSIFIEEADLVEQYLNDSVTQAFVLGGLDPIDTADDMFKMIKAIREKTDDDIVIYTGYKESEVSDVINKLRQWPNIIIKFGRYVPHDKPRFDDTLGVTLASTNQYARKL